MSKVDLTVLRVYFSKWFPVAVTVHFFCPFVFVWKLKTKRIALWDTVPHKVCSGCTFRLMCLVTWVFCALRIFQIVWSKQHVWGGISVLRASSIKPLGSLLETWLIGWKPSLWQLRSHHGVLKSWPCLPCVLGKVSIDCCLKQHQRMWVRTSVTTASIHLHGTQTSAFTKWDPTRLVHVDHCTPSFVKLINFILKHIYV